MFLTTKKGIWFNLSLAMEYLFVEVNANRISKNLLNLKNGQYVGPVVSSSYYRSHTGLLFAKCSFLTVTDMHKLQLKVFMYRFSSGIDPSSTLGGMIWCRVSANCALARTGGCLRGMCPLRSWKILYFWNWSHAIWWILLGANLEQAMIKKVFWAWREIFDKFC